MTTIGAIVEGHGEVAALPVLVRRIASELLGGVAVDVLKPMRRPRSRLLRPGELERAVQFVGEQVGSLGGILVLLDANDDCAAKLAPVLDRRARVARPDRRIQVVLAVREFESWFLGGADSLAGKRTLSLAAGTPAAAEALRDAKGWLAARMETSYHETLDQPAFAAMFDLTAARSVCASFDKLVRAIAALAHE